MIGVFQPVWGGGKRVRMSEREERTAWDRAVGIFWRAAPWVGLIAMTELWRRSRQRVSGRLSVDVIATPAAFEKAEPRRGRRFPP